MNMPSVKTLEQAFPGKGKVLRELLTNNAAVRAHPAAEARIRECYHPPSLSDLRMTVLNAELEGHGVEYIRPGRGTKSPGFSYVNMGDTYNTTIVRLDGGRYRVTCWGDIVERGNYD